MVKIVNAALCRTRIFAAAYSSPHCKKEKTSHPILYFGYVSSQLTFLQIKLRTGGLIFVDL
jgi:hypothetical protein